MTSSIFVNEFAEMNCKGPLYDNFEHSMLTVSSTSVWSMLIKCFGEDPGGLIKSGRTAHIEILRFRQMKDSSCIFQN